MKKLALLFTLLSFAAQAGTNPVIWGPGNKATVIPPVLVVGAIQYNGGGSSAPQTNIWNSPTAVTGTVATTTTAVTGTGTKFFTEFVIGDSITVGGETTLVSAITTDTSITVNPAFAAGGMNAAAGSIATRLALPVTYVYPNGHVQIGGTRTSFINGFTSNAAFSIVGTAPSAASTLTPALGIQVMSYTGAAAGSTGIPVIRLDRVRGTEALPSATLSGDNLGTYQVGGGDGTSVIGGGPRMLGLTTENWSSSAHGAQWQWTVIPNTTTTSTTAMTLGQDLSLSVVGALSSGGDFAVGGAKGAVSGLTKIDTTGTPSVTINGASYVFTVTSANATVGATYTNNGHTFTVFATITGATTLKAQSDTGAPAASGTLTKTSGTGDATITFASQTTTNQDGGTATFNLGSGADGLLLLEDANDGKSALALLTGGGATLTIISDPSSVWSTSSNTASKKCVTTSSGTLTIQNNNVLLPHGFHITAIRGG